MTEQEAKEILTLSDSEQKELPMLKEVYAVAVNALEEIQQYRAIGTLEEIQNMKTELARWHTDKLNARIKNDSACMFTLICHNCDHKDDYIEELEAEIEAYRVIGTVEELQKAIERQECK